MEVLFKVQDNEILKFKQEGGEDGFEMPWGKHPFSMVPYVDLRDDKIEEVLVIVKLKGG